MFVHLLSITWLLCFISTTNSLSRFECTESTTCAFDSYECESGKDCEIICTGINACDGANFICPSTPNKCNLHCNKENEDDDGFGCSYMSIDASNSIGGSLDITASNKPQIMEYSIIKCPPNGFCNVNCDGNQGCVGITIISHPTTINLSITASGNNVLQNSNITCPNHDNQCSISVNGNYTNMLECMNIYAPNSFYDLDIECNYTTDINTNCYDECKPKLYCDDNYSNSCNISLINEYNDWDCISDTDTSKSCSVTSYPSAHPTEQPSNSPSRSPSYNPTQIPSNIPTTVPTSVPSNIPSVIPSSMPSNIPSNMPSIIPSNIPSAQPTLFPSISPLENTKYHTNDNTVTTTTNDSSIETVQYSTTFTKESTKSTDAGGEGKVTEKITSINNIIEPEINENTDTLFGMAKNDVFYLIIGVSLMFCICCCIISFTIWHRAHQRFKQTKLSKEIKMVKVKTTSAPNDNLPISYYDDDFDDYDGNDTTNKTSYHNVNHNIFDDNDISDSGSSSNDKNIKRNVKPLRLNAVPSESMVLQVGAASNISIASNSGNINNNNNNKNGINISIKNQLKMGNISALNEDDDNQYENNEGIQKNHRYSAITISDDDNDIEDMYDNQYQHNRHQTLGGIDENYDEELEQDKLMQIDNDDHDNNEGNIGTTNSNDKSSDDGDNNKQNIDDLLRDSDDEVVINMKNATPKIKQQTPPTTKYDGNTTTTTTTTDDNIDLLPSLPPEMTTDDIDITNNIRMSLN